MMQICASSPVRLAACLLLASTVACGSREETSAPGADVRAPSPRNAAPAPGSPQPTGPRIVVLGDSLTAGLGLAPEQAYPALLQDRVREKGLGYEVVNAGNSGDTSAAGLSRLDWALDGDVRILVVALGANDGLRGLPVEQLKRNLARIIERAQARGIQVVLAGMEAPPNWGDQYTRAFRDVYPALAAQYRLPFVPFLLEGVAGIERLNQRDGIHPTAEGDRIIADLVWNVLEPLVEQPTTRREGVAGS
jgi:acyl-CoA thioesterase-1